MLENHEHKGKTLINIKRICVHREDDIFPKVVGLKIHKIEHRLEEGVKVKRQGNTVKIYTDQQKSRIC